MQIFARQLPLQRAELPLLAQQGPSSSLPEVEGWRVHRCHGEQVRLQASSGQVSCASQISIFTCRHYYLERDARPTVTQRIALTEMEPANFSSPYQVKICKEKLVHRREEVDIETGRRRSWVEEEEREVYDLTGDTPVKTLPLPKRKVQESQSVQRSKFVGGSPPPVLSPSPMRPSSRLSSDPTSECPHHSSTPASAPRSTSRRGRRVNATLPPSNSPPTQVSCYK